MKLKDIKPNPNNPRVLRDDKFQKLKQSITEFPKMLSLRPMVIDENNVVLQTIAVDQSDITDSDGNITDAKTTEWANYITKSNGN